MSEELTKPIEFSPEERALLLGDLSKLDENGRASLIGSICDRLGIEPLTQPFAYIVLNGKLTLYAKRDCTDQLRKRQNVSITITSREMMDDLYVVTARATTPNGRTDESTGVVNIGKAAGEIKANLLMKAETKAKRRVTLSICGLGIPDESEIESIPKEKRDEPQPVTMTLDPEVQQTRQLKKSLDVIDEYRKRFRECQSVDELRKIAAEVRDKQPDYVKKAVLKDYQEQRLMILTETPQSPEDYFASKSAAENSKSADEQALYEGYENDRF